MYARFSTAPFLPEQIRASGGTTQFFTQLEQQPGFAGVVALRFAGSPGGALLTLWTTRSDAEQAPDRTAAAMGGPRCFGLAEDRVYEVLGVHEGRAAGSPPSMAQVVWFDGPRSEAQAAADALADRRVVAATEPVEGLVGAYRLRADDLSLVVVVLTTSVDAITEGTDRILATTPGPDEDPTLLRGPDRAQVAHVAAHRPAPVAVG